VKCFWFTNNSAVICSRGDEYVTRLEGVERALSRREWWRQDYRRKHAFIFGPWTRSHEEISMLGLDWRILNARLIILYMQVIEIH
jgi:hypothetical protein